MNIRVARHMPALVIIGVAVTQMTAVSAEEVTTDAEFYERSEEFNIRKALRYKSPDDNFTLRLGGRLHVDGAWFDDDKTDLNNSGSTDAEFRRARLFVSGKVYQDWRYRFDYDFAAEDDYEIKGAWVGYNGFKSVTIRAGNVQEPFSLEELTSSNNITFMERALPNVFAPSFKVGALVNTYGDNWSAAGGVFEGKIQNGGDDGWGTAARFTAAPLLEKTRLLHLGASIEYRQPDEVRYASRSEAHLVENRLLSTGTLRDVDNTVTWGLEAATVQGPFSLQGEYMRASVERDGRSDPDFDGWYVYGSWFVTGEHRRYNRKKGSFKQVRPDSRYGAWELGLRYSTLDLEDANVTGGESDNITVGVNWYLNRYLRFMANYIRVDADPNRNGQDETPNIFQIRGQLVF